MKLKRLVSAVLAVGMALTMLPTAVFAAVTVPTGTDITDTLNFDTEGKPILNGGVEVNNVYYYPTQANKQWQVSKSNMSCSIISGYSYGGAGSQKINVQMSVSGIISGGVYANSVATNHLTNTSTGVVTIGSITGGIFQKPVGNSGEIYGGIFLDTVNNKTTGEINGGIFAKDPKVTNECVLNANGCKIYSPDSYKLFNETADEKTSISNVAYTVGEQEVVVSTYSPTFDHWEINGTRVDAGATVDEDGNAQITFTVPENATEVTVEPVVKPVEFKLGANGMPEYKGKEYLGNLDLDGWSLTKTETSTTLRIAQGCTVDLGNHCVDWAIRNWGTLKNGITPGNVANQQNEDGTYGRVENIAFKMNVNFGGQDTNITWMTVKNAVVNDVFPDIVGVIGTQTLTVKATVSPFDGWSYSGTVSEDVAKQIEAQKNNETLTLTLTGEEGKADTIALTAKTTGDTFDMTLVDGTASVDGKEVTTAQKDQTVTLTAADAPDGMVFDRWEITPSDVALTLEEAGFDSHAATASFKMPAQTLNIRAMYRMADQPEEPNVLGTVAMVATAGVGAAVVGYTGYMIGTELYLNTVLPEGTAIPNNTTELAKLLWTDAGQPAPAAVLAADATDEQKALTWAVENRLISADKAADASVGRWEVMDAWNKAQEMKG